MDEKAIRASEREAIKALITLDLLVEKADTVDKLVSRIIQMIDKRGEDSE